MSSSDSSSSSSFFSSFFSSAAAGASELSAGAEEANADGSAKYALTCSRYTAKSGACRSGYEIAKAKAQVVLYIVLDNFTQAQSSFAPLPCSMIKQMPSSIVPSQQEGRCSRSPQQQQAHSCTR